MSKEIVCNEDEISEIGLYLCKGRSLLDVLKDYCEFNAYSDAMIVIGETEKILSQAMERLDRLW